MVYSLALAQGAPEPSVTVIRDLAEAEYAAATEANAFLYRWYHDDSLLVMAELNYRGFRRDLADLADELPKAGGAEMLILESAGRMANLHALNVLSSVRTFLDHTETAFKRRYGKTSPELDRFKKACSNAYDSSFSYRFTYRLRNYAQHCGLPIQEVRFDSQLTDRAAMSVAHRVALLSDRDRLLAGFDGWGPVGKELQAMPEKIDIAEHLDGLMSALRNVYAAAAPHAEELGAAVRTLSELLSGVDLAVGRPCLVEGIENYSESESWNLTLKWLHLELLEAAGQIV